MYRKSSRISWGFAIAMAAICSGGCSEQTPYDVTGTVTYNGEPLDKPDGQISFIGPSGVLVTATIAADGTYRAVKVSGGVNRVSVNYSNPQAKSKKSAGKRKLGDPEPKFEPTFITPEKYASVETSELTVTVTKETVFDVKMTGPSIK